MELNDVAEVAMVDGMAEDHAAELAQGERFEFGANWSRFLSVLDDRRIAEAEESLKRMLDVETLAGRSFLDIGSGSGLFSLAARRLGARVRSFDFDPKSVACTRELKRQYFPDDPSWVIEPGSALDRPYITSLGAFDVVYSWGVLHHTGAMWEALANAADPVAANGLLFIAIYNHQRYWSRFNLKMNRLYVRSPRPIKALLVGGFAAVTILRGLAKNAALMPTYIAVRETGGPPAALQLLANATVWAAASLVVVSVVLGVASPLALQVVGARFDPAKLTLTHTLFLMLLPVLVLNGLATVWSAVLNADHRFASAALAPIAVPVTAVACLVLFGRDWGIVSLAVGTLFGYVLKCLWVGFDLRRRGLWARPAWNGITPEFRQVIGWTVHPGSRRGTADGKYAAG